MQLRDLEAHHNCGINPLHCNRLHWHGIYAGTARGVQALDDFKGILRMHSKTLLGVFVTEQPQRKWSGCNAWKKLGLSKRSIF
jgi:hypothetical protein